MGELLLTRKKKPGAPLKEGLPKKVRKTASTDVAGGPPKVHRGAPRGPPDGSRQSSSFAGIGCVPDGVVEALRGLGFTHCTPVQEATLPLLLPQQQQQQQQRKQQKQQQLVTGGALAASRRFGDVAVEAPTGSGKTLAFLIPAVSRLLEQQLLQQQQRQQQQQQQQEEEQQDGQQQQLDGGDAIDVRAALTETPEEEAAAAALAAASDPEAAAAADAAAASELRCRVGVLVVAPTRELCCQTHAVLLQLLYSLEAVLLQPEHPSSSNSSSNSSSKRCSSSFLLRAMCLTGGARPLEADSFLIRKKCSKRAVYILTATPGRLLSLLGLPQQQQVRSSSSNSSSSNTSSSITQGQQQQ